ncbi:MAG: tetratricopeptide repeat protein [Planctomycetes bacterium]|nr:tetratricopeptide repeat protein [Planctomycetota bacterium]
MAGPHQQNGSRNSGGGTGLAWVWPVLLGVAAAVAGAFLTGKLDFLSPPQAASLIARARDALDQNKVDLALGLAAQAADADPRMAAPAALVAARAMLAQAQSQSESLALATARDAEAKLAGIAEDQLDQADQNLLKVARGRLSLITRTGMDQAIAGLKSLPEDATCAAEAYEVLGSLSLRMDPPDYAGALRANESLRALATLTDERRAAVQIAAAELNLKLGKGDEARKVLDKVGPRAPAELRLKARLLSAKSYHDETRWADASSAWQAVLQEKPDPASAAMAWYRLGQAQSRLGHLGEAARAWQEAITLGAPEVAQAASLNLAELRAVDPSGDPVLRLARSALRDVNEPAKYANTLLPANQARELLERIVSTWAAAARFENALALNEATKVLGGPTANLARRAELLEAEARHLRDQVGKPDIPAKERQDKACERFIEAAACHSTVADLLSDPDLQADQVWQAARLANEAGRPKEAVSYFTRFIRMGRRQDRLGEAWYRLGEALREQDNKPAALQAYRNSISFITPYAYRARYRLAADAMARGDLDAAADALEQNIQLLRLEPDPEAQQMSLYALGSLLHQRRNWSMCARRLEEALERYPANPQSGRARLMLADSYRNLAAQEHQNFLTGEKVTAETRDHFQAEHRRWLERAVATYRELLLAIELEVAGTPLTESEKDQVFFLLADSLFNLGRYEDALYQYRNAQTRLTDPVQRLVALGGEVRCHSAMNQFTLMNSRLQEIRQALPSLEEKVRKQWEGWLDLASRSRGMP